MKTGKIFTLNSGLIALSFGLFFMGRGMQHFFFETPYRFFFWSRSLLETPVKNILGLEWNTYMTDTSIDLFWTHVVQAVGLFYFALGVSVLTIFRHTKTFRWCSKLGFILFLPYVYLSFLGYSVHLLQVLEFALQLAPVLLIAFFHRLSKVRTLGILRFCISVTFAAHGLYAMGVFPVPHSFVQMTNASLGLNNAGASTFLHIAGILDLVLALGIWLPFRSVRIGSLMYALLWGFATAFARLYANIYAFDFWNGVFQWWYEFLVRCPHFLIPLLVLRYDLKSTNSHRSIHFLSASNFSKALKDFFHVVKAGRA